MRHLFKACIILFFATLSCRAEWPEALLPPGVRSENAPPGGMTFPVLLSEIIIPLEKEASIETLMPPAIAFSPDGKFLAAYLPDSKLHLQNIYKNKQVWEQPLTKPITSLTFSNDGTIIFGLSKNDLVAISAETGKERWQMTPDKILLSSKQIRLLPQDDTSSLLVSIPDSKQTFFQKVDSQGKAIKPVKHPAGDLLGVDIVEGNAWLLCRMEADEQTEKVTYQIVEYTAAQNRFSTIHSFIGPASATGSLAISPDAEKVAVAVPGIAPFILPLGVENAKPAPLLVGNSIFTKATADSAKTVIFSGAIGKDKKPSATAGTTDLVVWDTETQKKWRLQGSFVPDAVRGSENGRWIAALANSIPVRGQRGQGLVLMDNLRRGKGEKKISYTFTTKSAPIGPLTMAADGSAMAFAEWRATDKKLNGPALVINILR